MDEQMNKWLTDNIHQGRLFQVTRLTAGQTIFPSGVQQHGGFVLNNDSSEMRNVTFVNMLSLAHLIYQITIL